MTSKWSKYYTIVQPTPSTKTIQDSQDVSGGTLYNSHSWYQRLVQGSSTRMTRYREYDGMDNDVDVSRALDTISEEMTQMNRKTKLHVDIVFDEIDGTVPNTTAVTLSTALRFWSKAHKFDQALFNIARNTVKYGDCFFKKGTSPTKKWEYIHAKNVIACVVDANDVTNIVAWQIRKDTKQAQANLGGIGISGQQYESEFVPADEIIRFTLNDDMSETAPFGESILKPVYRSFKQKELLEDAIIIYRISRAPERRVFYIDTGKMPPQRTKQYLEQVKNEIKQKKIPTQNGAGDNQVESIYNPHCLDLSTEIPLLDGRVLPLSEIIELHDNGEEMWAYSCNPTTGEFAPGLISWAGITKTNAEVIEITFDNKETLICTPDHKIPVQGKGFVPAGELTPDDCLFPLDDSSSVNITTIKVMEERRTVGTLTIDQEEIHHNYHTFAVKSGIYVKNSTSEDFFFAQRCLSLQEKIPLLDGRTLTLSQLIDEHNQGKQNFVYSVDQSTGKFIPGEIEWAGLTRKNAELVEVLLDSGEKIVCTPDHKFVLRDGSEVEAQFLDITSNLMCLDSHNYKVISVTKLDRREDTGCLTIKDPGNNHNFALASGVYVKNSDGKGSRVETLPGGCFSMDTKVPLLDGRTLTIQEIAEEHKQGKQNWAYSVDPLTGNFIPGIISWAGITHNLAEVYEVELDNGEKFVATGDHKFPVWGKGPVRLDEIDLNDSLFSFNTKQEHISSSQKYQYTQVYNHKTKKWEFVHRSVVKTLKRCNQHNESTFLEEYTTEDKKTIHHINGNKLDNNPYNLTLMNAKDHIALHKSKIAEIQHLGTKASKKKYYEDEMYQKQVKSRLNDQRTKFKQLLESSDDLYDEYCEKVSKGVKTYIHSLSENQKQNRDIISVQNLTNATRNKLQKLETNPEYKRRVYEKSSTTLSKLMSEGGALRQQTLDHMKSIRQPIKNQTITFSDDMITIVRYIVDSGVYDSENVLTQLNTTPEFMKLWNILNEPQKGFVHKINKNFSHSNLIQLLNNYGYENWKEFKQERMRNRGVDYQKFNNISQEKLEILKFLISLIQTNPSIVGICEVINQDAKLKNEFVDKYNKFKTENMKSLFVLDNIKHNHLDNVAKLFNYESFSHVVVDKELFNHKIVKITKLDTKIPVGTLTIDQKETLHGFHTFAINSGVYTFNSGLGELSDLEYFQARVYRGLRIPTSYMSTSSKDQNPIFNDGRIGQAYIEELRFAEFCMRLQRNIESVLDEEFKNYLRALNIDVDPSIFRLKLPEPTNFGIYKQQEADSAILSTLANADSIGFLAKRFVLARFGQLEEEEILRNERLKCEEMNIESDDPDRFQKIYGNKDDTDDFGGLGDLSGGDLGGEMSSMDIEPPEMDAGDEELPEEI